MSENLYRSHQLLQKKLLENEYPLYSVNNLFLFNPNVYQKDIETIISMLKPTFEGEVFHKYASTNNTNDSCYICKKTKENHIEDNNMERKQDFFGVENEKTCPCNVCFQKVKKENDEKFIYCKNYHRFCFECLGGWHLGIKCNEPVEFVLDHYEKVLFDPKNPEKSENDFSICICPFCKCVLQFEIAKTSINCIFCKKNFCQYCKKTSPFHKFNCPKFSLWFVIEMIGIFGAHTYLLAKKNIKLNSIWYISYNILLFYQLFFLSKPSKGYEELCGRELKNSNKKTVKIFKIAFILTSKIFFNF